MRKAGSVTFFAVAILVSLLSLVGSAEAAVKDWVGGRRGTSPTCLRRTAQRRGRQVRTAGAEPQAELNGYLLHRLEVL